jgi:hypothetical protein
MRGRGQGWVEVARLGSRRSVRCREFRSPRFHPSSSSSPFSHLARPQRQVDTLQDLLARRDDGGFQAADFEQGRGRRSVGRGRRRAVYVCFWRKECGVSVAVCVHVRPAARKGSMCCVLLRAVSQPWDERSLLALCHAKQGIAASAFLLLSHTQQTTHRTATARLRDREAAAGSGPTAAGAGREARMAGVPEVFFFFFSTRKKEQRSALAR